MENAELPSTCFSARLVEKLKKLMQTQEHQLTAMHLESEEQKNKHACKPQMQALYQPP